MIERTILKTAINEMFLNSQSGHITTDYRLYDVRRSIDGYELIMKIGFLKLVIKESFKWELEKKKIHYGK